MDPGIPPIPPRQPLATLVLTLGMTAALPALVFYRPAAASDQVGSPRIAQEIGPLHRGPNGEIEVLKPATPATPTTSATPATPATPGTLATPGGHPASIVCPSAKRDPAASSADKLSGLAPGHWLDVANSHLLSVAYKGTWAAALSGVEGPRAIMSAWGGATLDTEDDALIVWGGGHTDYFGNEVYAFSLKTLTWSMLDQPSDPTGYTGAKGAYMPDGKPVVIHTYDEMAYDPTTKQVIVTGAAAGYANNQGGVPNDHSYPYTWAYKLSTNTWKQLANNTLGSPIDNITHYDSANGLIYGINSATGLQVYDPKADSWSAVGFGSPLPDYHMTGAIDPGANILVAIGSGFLRVVDLSTGALGSPPITGDLTAQHGNAPGFVWDQAARQFVGWNGGDMVYALDPATWHWTAYKPAPENTVTPTAAQPNGTFGRFQYDAADRVFIAVNAVDQDVYLYRPCF